MVIDEYRALWENLKPYPAKGYIRSFEEWLFDEWHHTYSGCLLTLLVYTYRRKYKVKDPFIRNLLYGDGLPRGSKYR